MKSHREAGFTFIETLLTLFIVSLLMFVPILSIEKITESIQIDLFFRELSSTITMMQNHAILTGRNVVIEFLPRENLIRFKEDKVIVDSTHSTYREIILEEGLYEFNGSGYGQVIFNGHTGNITSVDGWTTHFKTSKGLYKLIFWLGSGRFEIQKIK